MNTPDKIAAKRNQLIERTSLALNLSQSEVLELFTLERLSSFRINQLKVTDELSLLAEISTAGWVGTQSAFYEPGYSITAGRKDVINSDAVRDGLIFVQNQASWLPVLALDPQPGEKILDICAAPGGKGSHIAEITQNESELWVNDNSRARLFKLRANFSRTGTRYSQQTMYGLDRIAHVLPRASFDKILFDAPCSGEGLMDITRDKDFTYWSLAQIKRLQQLQKKGIMAAWKLLKPGGRLIYSTCTMAPEENEAVVDYLLSRVDNAKLSRPLLTPFNRIPTLRSWNNKPFKSDLQYCLRLAPSTLIEAFFVASITKLSESQVRYTDSNEQTSYIDRP